MYACSTCIHSISLIRYIDCNSVDRFFSHFHLRNRPLVFHGDCYSKITEVRSFVVLKTTMRLICGFRRFSGQLLFWYSSSARSGPSTCQAT